MNIVSEHGMMQLCNAVIIQAAKDYRKHKRYLIKHPHTPELELQVKEARAERKRMIDDYVEREKNFIADREYRKWMERHEEGDVFDREAFKKAVVVTVPRKRFPLTKEERILEQIVRHEIAVDEIERFFLSKWYTVLTDVDGTSLLKKLKEEFACESD